jgi:hypothetical protein
MDNAICINGPAKGQSIYLHDGWEAVRVEVDDGIALYKFNYVCDDGKLMCKFIGMEK